MKILLILATSILLTGCLATPVKRTFPDVPAELMTACPNLSTVAEGTEQLSEVLKVITENYSQYHECRIKNDLWIEWYKAQKEIFNSVK
jgi:uncharacterized lipoprotein YajG